jgi:hypothetical protein
MDMAAGLSTPCVGGCGTRVQSGRLCLNCWRIWSFEPSDSPAPADTRSERRKRGHDK